ncbi:MAG: hypothetical protein P1U55_11145 [Vannielia sp.]|nr:hypothetical protein [Vannielia sp.]MDF1873194.1 hypothetical protein [Vannielia sp.]
MSAPTPAEIGQIIRQPAMRAGLRFEEHPETGARLDDELRDVAVSEPDSLPLLEFTLEELYHRRSPEGVLTWESYESLGGLAGALGRRAEETFLQQSDAARAALPRVMRRIIHLGVGEDQAPTKRPAPLSGFAPNSPERQLVDAFVEARLLVVGSDSAGEPQVALTHEALLSSWPRLKEWLAADRDYLRIRARVNFAADRWEESGRDAQMLLPKGRPLDEARQIYGEADMDLPQSMTSFIAQSIRRATRARRVKQAAVATLAALSILASGAAWYADGQRREAAQARTISEAAQAQAVQSAAEARAARATAETEQARAEANAIAAQSAQTEAERSAAAAEARLAELFLEQGRQALVAGRVEEATLLLGAAFSGSEKESVGTLFSQARDLAAMRGEEVQVHSGQITAIATSADGKTALASVDGSILVRRQGTGEIVGRHAGDDSALHGLAFSPSGRYLAAGGDGGTVLLWDLQTKIMRPLDGHFQTVFGLSFSDDGGTLVSRSHDKTTRLWRVDDGAELSVIAEPVGSPLAAEYLPKDNRLITVNSGGLVTIWDVGTGESLQRCSVEFENQIQDAQLYGTGFAVLAMGENGTRRISVSDDCAEIWHNASPSYGLHHVDALTKIGVRHEAGASVLDLRTGQEITRLERANPTAEKSTMIASVVSPNKTLAAILDNEGVLSIHDALGGRAIAEIKAHAAPGSAMAFSDDGAVLITGAADGTATTWHVGALRPCQIDEGTGRAAAFSPDGKYLASGNSKGAVTLVQVETCSKVFSASLATADWVQDILFSADGAYIAVAAGTDVAVLQAGDGREVWSHRFSPDHLVTSLTMQEGLTGLIVGTRVGAPWNNKGGWFELDFATGGILQKSASPENAISRVEIWNDGAYVLSRSRYGLDLWWRHTGERRLQVGYRSVRRVAFFPGKTRMALGDDDGVVRVIRHTRSELFRFKAHDAPISAIAVNSDETLLATAAQDGTAALWNAQTGALIAQMAVQPTEIRAFAFVSGTSFLLSAAADGRVVLWDQTAGTAVSKFDGPAGRRPRLAVSPTGQVFSVSVGNESTRIWPLPTSRVPVDQVSAVISEVTPWGHSVDDALPQDRWQSLALEALASKQADEDFVSIETRKQLEMGRLAAVRQDAVSAGRNWGQAPFDAADLPASLSASFDVAMAANSVVLRGLRKVLTEHKERVEHIGFSHDGRWLSSVDWNGRLILWDGSDWTKRLEPEGKFGSDVSFSPDDTRLLASAPYGGLVVLDTEDGSEVLKVAEGHTGQWSADGTQFAAFPRLGPPIVFDATTGAVVARFTTLGSDGSGFSLSPDLKTLALGTEAGVALLDTVSRAEAALVSPPRTTDEDRPDLLFSRFSPDGKRIAVIWTDNTGAVFDVESKERLFDLPADALFVQFGKTVDRILVSQKKRKVSLIDSSDGSVLEKLDGDLPSNGGFQAGETLFAILDGGAKSIQLHGVETGRYHGSYINHATSWLRLVTSPDEKTRVSVSGDGALLIWDIQDDVGPLRPSETSFEALQEDILAEHPDGGALVQLGSNAALRVDGQVSSLLSGHAGRVTAGAITQDGDRVLTGGEGGKVLIWNRETLQLQRTIPDACSKPVAAVLPTVDNAGLWVHCEDGALRLIDMERGEPLIAFMAKPADTSKPGRMAFSDDGKSLELRGSDGPYLWQIAP